MKRIVFILLFLAGVAEIFASPASKNLRTETQANGTTISYFVRGDEKLRYFLTTDGYTLLKNTDGIFVYAQKDENGNLVAGNILAHNKDERTPAETAFLATIEPFLQYSDAQIAVFLGKWEDKSAEPQKAKSTFSVSDGNINSNPDTKNGRHTRNLVILVNFSDKSFVVENPQQKFSDMLNQPNYSYNGATGSVRDYFSDNSMGVFQPDFTVVGPYTLPQPVNYYGENDGNNDLRPGQMVVDACNLAYLNGVNFSPFDTDGDNYVDDVFIYYAGYNEAEGAPANTIWPHRDVIHNYTGNITFNGKKIRDYACTSELRSTTGNVMCGIGTFCHEFGHVLGLPDMYYHDYSYLDDWDIMDGGLYNNDGRTPPAYSSYERYFMGWLVPEILNAPTNETLEDLKNSNRALIITDAAPNFNGFVPSPKEFFLLENRQQTDWDSYLPYHGLLIWHINYNAADWYNNTPNKPSYRGIFIEPADGRINSFTARTGQIFPGSSGKTYFSPKFRNNSYLGKSITHIAEENGIISFDYEDGIVTLYNVADENLKIWTNLHTLYLSGLEKNTQITVLKTDGQVILTKTSSNFDEEIPLLHSGMYLLKLQNGEKTSIHKFVIF
ncbi:MAG: M6 family metalloprotease domain-containing protein [Prevotellaceae bacterium]|jgi:M6 family metalloprotease-like protein|nr:M6 family metalloprotease domain-containing protein [Prevotellaceae bacterium]